MRQVLPWPSSLSSSMRPPWTSTAQRAMQSPRPAPPRSRAPSRSVRCPPLWREARVDQPGGIPSLVVILILITLPYSREHLAGIGIHLHFLAGVQLDAIEQRAVLPFERRAHRGRVGMRDQGHRYRLVGGDGGLVIGANRLVPGAALIAPFIGLHHQSDANAQESQKQGPREHADGNPHVESHSPPPHRCVCVGLHEICPLVSHPVYQRFLRTR